LVGQSIPVATGPARSRGELAGGDAGQATGHWHSDGPPVAVLRVLYHRRADAGEHRRGPRHDRDRRGPAAARRPIQRRRGCDRRRRGRHLGRRPCGAGG